MHRVVIISCACLFTIHLLNLHLLDVVVEVIGSVAKWAIMPMACYLNLISYFEFLESLFIKLFESQCLAHPRAELLFGYLFALIHFRYLCAQMSV